MKSRANLKINFSYLHHKSEAEKKALLRHHERKHAMLWENSKKNLNITSDEQYNKKIIKQV